MASLVTKVDEVKFSDEGWTHDMQPNGVCVSTKTSEAATATICRLDGLPPVQVGGSFPVGGQVTVSGELALVDPNPGGSK